MNPLEQTDPQRERRLDEVVAEWVKAREAGDMPDPRAWLERHPDLAEDLKSFFAADEHVRQIASSWRLEQPNAAARSTETKGETIGIDEPFVTVAHHVGGNFGDYELLAEVARGGMGIVYKARQKRLNRTVAVKMILAGQLADSSEVRRFAAEAEAAAGLDHSGIVPVYESGEIGGQHFFSMGFVDGPSLAEVLTAGSLAPRRAAELLVQVADAVEYAHRQGVIHRDLKPGDGETRCRALIRGSGVILDGAADGEIRSGGADRLIVQQGAVADGQRGASIIVDRSTDAATPHEVGAAAAQRLVVLE